MLVNGGKSWQRKIAQCRAAPNKTEERIINKGLGIVIEPLWPAEPLKPNGVDRVLNHKSVETSEQLGHYHWVVERTHSRLNRFSCLKIRYEQRSELHLELHPARVY